MAAEEDSEECTSKLLSTIHAKYSQGSGHRPPPGTGLRWMWSPFLLRLFFRSELAELYSRSFLDP